MSARDLRESARLLRVLHAVERAHELGDHETVRSLLWGLDPIEIRKLAVALEGAAAANGGESIGGTLIGCRVDGATATSAATFPAAVRPRHLSLAERVGEYSMKVPCR